MNLWGRAEIGGMWGTGRADIWVEIGPLYGINIG